MVDDFIILKGKELYNDGRIRIHESVHDANGHDVVIGNTYLFLDKGIMSDWANTNITRIESSYFNLRRISYESENPSVPIGEFGWALAKAKIRELEDRLFSIDAAVSL